MNALKYCLFLTFTALSLHWTSNPVHSRSTRDIEIVIIDFLYVDSKFKTVKNLERDVLIPGIDKALNLLGKSEHRFIAKRVSRVVFSSEEYFILSVAEKHSETTSYDVGIWGHVVPLGENLGDYRLGLMVFTNPARFDTCLFYYEIEIRDGRIQYWNNQKCDLPETLIGILPGALCCNVISETRKDAKVRFNCKSVVERYLGKNPNIRIQGQHPEQDCYNQDKVESTYGWIYLETTGTDKLVFRLHRQLFEKLALNESAGTTYNLPVERIERIAAEK